MPSLSARIAGVAIWSAVLMPPVAAQHPPVAPSTWAITNARIETVSGPAISRGTVVIRDGLIAAVGSDVPVPADARVIDGKGLTVYPGMVDGYGSLGIPSASGQGSTPRPDPAPNSSYAAGLQPEVRAVALLAPKPGDFHDARKAGFTVALTAQPGGVFRGSSALIALDNADNAALIIGAPIAQHVGFSRGGFGGGYPGSLMGVMAQFRQEMLDAQHYRDRRDAYGANPSGRERPTWNPSLEALVKVLDGEVPVIFQANTEREITRALGLAAEFGLKPIIAGGAEAAEVAGELKAAGASVIFDIDFPRRTAPTGAAARAAAEDAPPESMSTLRSRVEQPRGPGRLAAAGVPLALHSGGEFDDFIANLRRAVEAGLDRSAAIRSLTIEPARIFGVADRLGSIEAGKIANLTIVSGDLFDDGRVARLFIDGNSYQFDAPAATAGGRGAAEESTR